MYPGWVRDSTAVSMESAAFSWRVLTREKTALTNVASGRGSVEQSVYPTVEVSVNALVQLERVQLDSLYPWKDRKSVV